MTAPMKDRQHVLLWAVLALTGITVSISVLLIVFGLPQILRSADNSGAVVRGNDLQACRALRNTLVTDAADHLDGANADVVDTIAAIVAASLRGDRATATGLAPLLEERRIALFKAERAKSAAVSRYRAAVNLSRTNPSKFLTDCKADGG